MTFRGWLLDLYLNQEEGLTLWFIGEDDTRVCFRQAFPVTFYAAGPNEKLRALWKRVSGKAGVLGLSRTQKQDVFAADPVDVMRIDMNSPANQAALFRDIEAEFPDLTYYDADVTIGTRYMARHGVFPLALCELEADENQIIQSIRPLNTRWDLIPDLPPLRILELKPDCDPSRGRYRRCSCTPTVSRGRFRLTPPAITCGCSMRHWRLMTRISLPQIGATAG